MSLKPVKPPFRQRQVLVCTNLRDPAFNRPSCGAHGGIELRERLNAAVKERGLMGELLVNGASCLGFCPDKGCAVGIHPDNEWLLVESCADDEAALLQRILPA